MKKRLFVLFFAIYYLSTCAPTAYASSEYAVMPRYQNISTIAAGISCRQSAGIVDCSGSVTAKSNNPVKIYIQLSILENGTWRTLKSWSTTGTLTAYISRSYAVQTGHTYQVLATGYVYDSSGHLLESGSTTRTAYYPSS